LLKELFNEDEMPVFDRRLKKVGMLVTLPIETRVIGEMQFHDLSRAAKPGSLEFLDSSSTLIELAVSPE
jgi:hypothetical protein